MMRRVPAALALALSLAAPAAALDWGGIVPGVSTLEQVRALYGAPSRTATQKLEGFDAAQWVYEGARAPAGLARMTVDFGLKPAAGYRPELVRSLTLEPKPGIFTRELVIAGWGPPDSVGRDGDVELAFWIEGLLLSYDRDGWNVTRMVFSPPQPRTPGEAQPAKPPAAQR